MKVVSRKKGFPILGTLGILSGIALIVYGWIRRGDDDSGIAWIWILNGVCLVTSWTMNIRNQVVCIVVDDESIRFLRRDGDDLTIDRSSVIDAEPGSNRIRFRYKGPLDVRRATIPLRRFGREEAGLLRAEFPGEE